MLPFLESDGQLGGRWSVIEEALLRPMTSSYDIEEAILSYNSRYKNRWDFTNLHSLFTQLLTAQESQHFFEEVMPGLVQLTLALPSLFPQVRPGQQGYPVYL